jgi:hypothetical protein
MFKNQEYQKVIRLESYLSLQELGIDSSTRVSTQATHNSSRKSKMHVSCHRAQNLNNGVQRNVQRTHAWAHLIRFTGHLNFECGQSLVIIIIYLITLHREKKSFRLPNS